MSGKAGKGNIVLHGFLRLKRGRRRRYRCKACGRTFVSSLGTQCLAAPLELLRCHYNFIRPHGGLKVGTEVRTPAMQAGLVGRKLTFRDVFMAVAMLFSFVVALFEARWRPQALILCPAPAC